MFAKTGPTRCFARYINRGQAQSIGAKDTLEAYQYQPEMMSKLAPGPSYTEKPLGWSDDRKKRIRDSHYNSERLRNNELVARANAERFATGRMHAHLNLEKMRRDVYKMKKSE